MKGKFLAIAMVGLMFATAFAGCTGGDKPAETSGVAENQPSENYEGAVGMENTTNETASSEAGNESAIFSDNFDDNKMDSNWKTADCDNVDGTAFEEKEGMVQIYAGGIDMYQRGDLKCDEYGAVYYSKADGDFIVVVKVVSEEVASPMPSNDYYYPGTWAKAGIMIRNDVSAAGSSPGYVFIAAAPSFWEFTFDNDSDGYVESGPKSSERATFPCWLKVVKEGKAFTGYYSTDGNGWKELGKATLDSANPSQDVGIFHCAATGVAGFPIGWGDPNLAKFDDFMIKRW